MTKSDPDWKSIFASAGFINLVRRRRAVALRLVGISMLLFFSIPFIVNQFPALFRIRVFGPINLGLIYCIAQYLIGAVIAYRYALQMRRIDDQVATIKSAL